jgi:hypothetical protein
MGKNSVSVLTGNYVKSSSLSQVHRFFLRGLFVLYLFRQSTPLFSLIVLFLLHFILWVYNPMLLSAICLYQFFVSFRLSLYPISKYYH